MTSHPGPEPPGLGTRTRRRPPIADYGFLSDCHSAALVDRWGSVDWWCVPRFDSPSVFGRLLDPAAGHWALHPSEEFQTERHFVGDTLVLRTVFRTEGGEVAVTDALALEPGARGHEIGLRSPHVLLRRVEGRSGLVQMRTELIPRMEYGRTQPHLRAHTDAMVARGGPVRLSCTGPVTWQCDGGGATATFPVAAGDTVELRLSYSPSFGTAAQTGERDEPTLQDTIEGWESWTALHTSYDGCFPDEVRRSSLVLQGAGHLVVPRCHRVRQRPGAALRGGRSRQRRAAGQLPADVLPRRADQRCVATRARRAHSFATDSAEGGNRR